MTHVIKTYRRFARSGGCVLGALLTAVLTASSAAIAEPDAREIAKASAEAERVAAWSGQVEVTDQQRDQSQRRRSGVIRNRLTDNAGSAQRHYLLTAPQDIKGTTLLIHEHSDVDDDFWLYLPSLGKPRRVAGSSKKNSFVGTQYAIVDLQSFEHEKYEHRLIASESCDEGACWLIESIPSSSYAEEIGYSKLRSWILKDTFRTVRIEYYDPTGALYKRQTLKAFAAADSSGRKAIATRRIMTNERNGSRTSMSLDQVDFQPKFGRDEFSPSRLGR